MANNDDPPPYNPYVSILTDPIEATCTFCKQVMKLNAASGMKLQLGDKVYVDYDKPFFGRCPRCKRQGTQVVTKVYTVTTSPSVTGFWKIPVDPGPSSATPIDSSDKPKE